MRLVIFGASGSIGKHLVSQALGSGHEVTVFTRNGDRFNDVQNKHLKIHSGDVLDAGSVCEAVKGQDAVICSLGAGRKGTVRSLGTKNIVNAMKQSGIKRFICQSTLGAGDSKGNLNFFWKHIMFGWFLKEAFLDHELQEQFVISSTLDWTIVRPAAFTNGKATGRYHHGFAGNVKSLKLKISRADVATFMLEQLHSDLYMRKWPGLSY